MNLFFSQTFPLNVDSQTYIIFFNIKKKDVTLINNGADLEIQKHKNNKSILEQNKWNILVKNTKISQEM